jgi:hypothetical protein
VPCPSLGKGRSNCLYAVRWATDGAENHESLPIILKMAAFITIDVESFAHSKGILLCGPLGHVPEPFVSGTSWRPTYELAE